MSNEAPTLGCATEERRHAIRDRGRNGIDYLEVLSEDQKTLVVYFIDEAPTDLRAANVVISGGRNVPAHTITVVHARVCEPGDRDIERDACFRITLDRAGDFSTYRLCLAAVDEADRLLRDDRGGLVPFPGFDPRYAYLDFSFKANCPTDLDCREASHCPPDRPPEPKIDYLAKDYATFRQLILDRLAAVMPDWRERHVPDLGITLVEILAYVGDQLSYFQDAVATEAYLGTARQRISVRRHARLVDYVMHEGVNARAWVTLEVSADLLGANAPRREQIALVSGLNDALGLPGRIVTWDDLRNLPSGTYEVFEPVGPRAASVELRRMHNELRFYTWGESQCCLPRGSTSATLRYAWGKPTLPPDDGGPCEPDDADGGKPAGRMVHLKPGDVLIFEEVIGPETGLRADADPNHRQAVRITSVRPVYDELYEEALLEITWHQDDALRFPLCLSSLGPDCCLIEDVSVARGNVILVDHGRTVDEALCEGRQCEVPAGPEQHACEGEGMPADIVATSGRFRPALQRGPLTHAVPVPVEGAATVALSAAATLIQKPHHAIPSIRLFERGPAVPAGGLAEWLPVGDLLRSDADDRHFVVEVDNRGRAQIRFGDGELGRRPAARARFEARYRLGNGPVGNVGRESIRHVVLTGLSLGDQDAIKPRNPLPATGGAAPQSIDEVKLLAPHVFRRRRERAITAADYAELAERHLKVQKAAATLRWNGSWYEVLVAIDPRGGFDADPALLAEVERDLYRYRRIGHDLTVRRARTVALRLKLRVCVPAGYLRGHMKAALLGAFGNRRLPDGRPGFFHPDALSFGTCIFLSTIVARAQAEPGVESVTVERLTRWPADANELASPSDPLNTGVLKLGPREIARLDNDPRFPENGDLELEMVGGR